MENKEIMVTEDVIETAEEIVVADSTNNIVKGLAIGGVAVLGACLAYKYVAKPVAAKIKAYVEQKKIEAEENAEEIVE